MKKGLSSIFTLSCFFALCPRPVFSSASMSDVYESALENAKPVCAQRIFGQRSDLGNVEFTFLHYSREGFTGPVYILTEARLGNESEIAVVGIQDFHNGKDCTLWWKLEGESLKAIRNDIETTLLGIEGLPNPSIGMNGLWKPNDSKIPFLVIAERQMSGKSRLLLTSAGKIQSAVDARFDCYGIGLENPDMIELECENKKTSKPDIYRYCWKNNRLIDCSSK